MWPSNLLQADLHIYSLIYRQPCSPCLPAKFSPGNFFKHKLKSFTLLQAAAGTKSPLKSPFWIAKKVVPKKIFPLQGRAAGLQGRDVDVECRSPKEPLWGCELWVLERMRFGRRVLALGAASPGLHLRKVTACFALSGNFIALCGAKVAASRAKRKRGGRGVEVRMGEERWIRRSDKFRTSSSSKFNLQYTTNFKGRKATVISFKQHWCFLFDFLNIYFWIFYEDV